ncbi:MAG: hypothetical protein ACOYZ6_05245 [Chloroflexota bacterium]
MSISKLLDKKQKGDRQVKIAALVFIALVVATVLLINPFKKRMPVAPSLNVNWETLENNAHKAYPDSYLTNVSIDVNGSLSYKFSAEYHSASQADLLLYVEIDDLSKVIINPFTSPPLVQSSRTMPIYRKDWLIDSQEALSLFARNDVANSCLLTSNGIVALSLYKNQTNDGELSTWELFIIDCPVKGNAKHFYLNANTGEFVDPFAPVK